MSHTSEKNYFGRTLFIICVTVLALSMNAQTQEPFAGIIPIPGIIEAENFDSGGEGISYHDTDAASRAGSNYRKGEGADVGIRPGGGYVIGYTSNDEWLEYTIDIAKIGSYDFEFIYSSGRDGALLGIDIDSVSLISNYALPRTIRWDIYSSAYYPNVALTAGTHIFKVKVDQAGFNLDKIIIFGQQEPFDAVISLPGVIEAENYDLGGEGTAYHDAESENLGGAYRSDGVDISGDSTSGFYVSQTASNEWLEYSVNVSAGGFYDIGIVYSTESVLGNSSIGAEIPAYETILFQNLTLPNSGVPGKVDTAIARKVFLPDGDYVLRINIKLGGALIHKFHIAPTDLSGEPITSSPRPWIWVNADDKVQILDNIAKYSWAEGLRNNLKSRVDGTKNAHKNNPASVINSIAAFPGPRSNHCNMLDKAVEAGILYFLYDDEDYAQLAADIINHYGIGLGVPDYKDCDFLTGESFFTESRTVYTRYAIAYDFIFNFVNKPGTTVYNKATGNRQLFNHAKAQQTSKNLADLVFKNGGLGSNHSILEGAGALYNVLCISDSVTREAYFKKFWNGDTRHDAFKDYTLKKFTTEQGLWPESMSYGKGPHGGVLKYMEIIDRFKPELNLISNNMRILNGAFVYEDFIYPNNMEIAAYGDSRRNSTGTEGLYKYVLKIADRKNLSSLKEKATTLLKQSYKESGYHPKIETDYLDWDQPLSLLWGVNFDLNETVLPYEYNASADITHAGVILQRNYNCPDPEMNGLVYYTGGAHYVHSHLSGLDMELYGAGYVMAGVAADMPHPDDRSLDVNRHYYRIYAGHNTVIVNGKSQGRGSGSWKGDGMLWQNTTKLKASEPKPLEDPVSESFSFSTQLLEDRVNNCDQQRTVSIVRTSPTSGYYIDIFRSKSLGINNFHDYVYHNIGDEAQMMNGDNTALSMTLAPDRYQSFNVVYNGATVKFPGWHYFENVKTSTETTETVKTQFKLNTSPRRYMHALMPGGLDREYSSALAPPILEVAAGYDKKKAQVLSIRQNGEAWNRPFIVVYEPSTNAEASVQSVDNIFEGDNVLGAKVTSTVQQTLITDYIIAQDNDQATYNNENLQLNFKGRFAIVRTEVKDNKTKVSMYIGDGSKLEFKGNEVLGDVNNKAFYTYDIDSVYDTGININRTNGIKVYPNPVQSVLTIEVNDSSPCSYAIFNMNGALIEQDHFHKKRVIDLSHQKTGLYFVRVETSKGSFSKKIIVKN